MTIKRREFITLLGGAAAWPGIARAQHPVMPVIGFLGSEAPDLWASRVRAFRQGLGETGYVEGRNVATEFRCADSRYDRLPELAADLVHRQVTVIVANGVASQAAKAATTTIPIVFSIAGDPVANGIVASLSRPGGNLTGVSNLNLELVPKRLEVLHELVPTASIIALLVNPSNPNAETESRDLQAAARTLGLELRVLHASTDRDLDTAFATIVKLGAGAVVIGSDAYFATRYEQLAALAVRHALPTICSFGQFVAVGGLMSYGGSSTDARRQVGVYTGRILKGEKPADLPVQQSTKFEFVINLKTAKTLGLSVPPSLLAVADEVIELTR
jgi:putative ABC transport system substrate-binding protein